MPRAALAAVLLAALASGAAADDLPFKLPKSKSTGVGGFADVADLSAVFVPARGKPGDKLTLRVTVVPKPGFYTYPVGKLGSGAPSTVNFAAGGPVVVAGDVPLPAGYVEKTISGRKEKVYVDPVTFEVPVTVALTATPGKRPVKMAGRVQVCDEGGCYNTKPADLPAPEFEFTTTGAAPTVVAPKPPDPPVVEVAAPDVPPAPVGNTPPVPVVPAAPPADAAAYAASLEAVAASLERTGPTAVAAGGLWGLLAAAVFWGFVSLATPCVFPMIPITVSLFLKQANQSTGTVVRLAAVYCLTIIAVIGAAAVLLLTAFQALSVNEWMNLFLGGLFVFFALSLFGMFEVTLPRVALFGTLCGWVFVLYRITHLRGFTADAAPEALTLAGAAAVLAAAIWFLLSGRADALESRFMQGTERGRKAGGLLGTIAGALAFSVVSFTCVAPFLGGFAGVLQSGGYSRFELVAAGLAFATAFASPFFVLALFPSLIKLLPKSGGWLDTVKVVMGFLELAAAFGFFRTAEQRVSGRAEWFTYELCLAAWVGIAVAAGLYLLNLYRLPHDYEERKQTAVGRLVLAVMFLGLAAYLAPGLSGHRPAGTVYAWVNAFLLPDPAAGKHGELPWSGDLKGALDQARSAAPGTPDRVFVDFTGVTCKNCAFNEQNVFPRPEVRALMERYRLVQLYTDTVPPSLTPGEVDRDALAEANAAFQQRAFRDIKLPLYAVLAPRPDGTIRVVGVYDEGKINDPAKFAAFLEEGLTE